MKVLGWNGNNAGLQLGLTVRVSNVFIRTADDSLKMWGSYITATNATVWQNWNGAPVNLGWLSLPSRWQTNWPPYRTTLSGK
jgi:hypothetical protein